ncbi:MAG TPA: flagellar hook protein FlgE [Roseiarcus sp.]|nr:flagellar hook protein FlgE [Roseiarcus sp.]
MSILNASVAGMLADSNWLSSISQNVANANTTGYKTVETDFSTLVDQVSSASADFGGVMTRVRSLNTMQGNVVSTSTATNLAVQGSGFFVVSDSSGALYLTRNGSFVPDAAGNLVNDAGYYLMGAPANAGPSPANSLTGLQRVNVIGVSETATPTTAGSLTANLPATATAIPAANLPSANSASSTYTAATSLIVYDNLGGSHTINLYFANTGAGTWEVDAYDASAAASGGGFPYSSGPLATGTLTFDPTTGALTSGGALSIAVPNGATMNLDLSKLTQFATSFGVTAATANGNAPASVKGVSISTDGTLSLTYSNGTSSAAYDIPLANVESPDSLLSVSGDVFSPNTDSGPVFLGTPGSGSFGAINGGSLENSTVDLATQLTAMIEAQSAYEANSKVFQTGATILDVLNGLKP